MRTRRFIFISIGVILVLGYMLGPNPSTPKYDQSLPVFNEDILEMESNIVAKESQHKVKSDNEARIVWNNDSVKEVTEYCIVYLHGYSASQEEGNPTHRNIAKQLNANLYLSRLAYHGIDTVENMKGITVDALWQSAKDALVIGKKLGKKVILMGTSTGGTLALILAATYPNDVYAVINMSPNVRLAHPLSFIANNPWGVQIGSLVVGGKNQVSDDKRDVFKKYWYPEFRLEAVAQLQELLETKMNKETFEAVTCPILNLYYYKNEKEQDDLVSVEAIKSMHAQLKSEKKKLVAVPTVGNHVMGSHVKSKDLDAVNKEISGFLKEVL
ncbi:MAG: alpha/beta hydrolase [Bacteroidota bacterium]|nr:alpha/beta hydrolase [Bacteroidota bacterium]